MSATRETHSVTLTSAFSITNKQLFRYLTQADYLQQWLAPDASIELNVKEYQCEAGAKYHFVYRLPDNSTLHLVGEFIEVNAPNLLVFTWKWLAPDQDANIESLVTWQIDEHEQGCQLTIVHEQIPTSSYASRHNAGWQGALSRLQRLIAKN